MVRTLIGIVTVGTLVIAPGAGAQRPKRNERPTDPQSQPAPRMCRVWLDGVRADSQPAPTDCATALRNRPPNGRVIFGRQGDRQFVPGNPAPDTNRRDDSRKRRPDKRRPEKPQDDRR